MKVWPGTTANRGEIIVEDGQFVGKLATAVAGSGNMVETLLSRKLVSERET